MQLIAAYGHFSGLAIMASCLIAEYCLLTASPTAALLKRLRYIDAGYGITAAVMLASGLARIYREKGTEYYMGNPWFWTKMALFAIAALISAYPTFCFLRSNSGKERLFPVTAIRHCVHLQALLILGIIMCAVMMARG